MLRIENLAIGLSMIELLATLCFLRGRVDIVFDIVSLKRVEGYEVIGSRAKTGVSVCGRPTEAAFGVYGGDGKQKPSLRFHPCRTKQWFIHSVGRQLVDSRATYQ